MNICKGLTKGQIPCKRRVFGADYCFQHSPPPEREQERPEDCPVCFEPMQQRGPLSCGHWVHIGCVVKSGKSECPICRSSLQLNKTCTDKINCIARKRRRESIDEEAENLRQMQVLMQELLNVDDGELFAEVLLAHIL